MSKFNAAMLEAGFIPGDLGAFKKEAGKTKLYFGGGGGGGTTTTQSSGTTYTTNIPEYARPYVENMLGATQEQLFTSDGQGTLTGFRPYAPYSTNMQDYIAPFSPMQQQAMASAANLQTPEQYAAATGLAGQAGLQALGTGQTATGLQGQALGYGQAGAGYGDVGQMYGALGAQQAQAASQQAAMQAARLGQQASRVGMQGLGYGSQAAGYGAGATGLGRDVTQLAQQQGLGYGAQGAGYGAGAAALAPAAQAYGQRAADIGTQGLGYGALGAGYGSQAAGMAGMGYGAGAQYAQQATSPAATQAYMSPYVQSALQPTLQEMQRQYDITGQQQKAQATAAGAFGGSREALMRAENQRNKNIAMNQAIGQGYQQAFQQAQQAQQFGANLGLQGLQAGTAAQQAGIQGAQAGLAGLGTGIQGQQAGLSGLQQAGSLYGLGMQGAQTGLQGLQGALAGSAQGLQGYQTGITGAQAGIAGISPALQGISTGLTGVGQQLAAGQLGLAGTAQGIQGAQAGMQGAGLGLQGVSGATAAGQYGLQGLGQATQAAGQLGQLGQQQLAAEQGIIGTQAAQGAQQQAAQQAMINQAIQNYATAQQYPLMQLGFMSNMLRGLPMQATSTQQYVAAPTQYQQAIGAAGTGASLYNAMKAKGGIVDSRASGGIVGYDVGGKVESILDEMTPDQLKEEMQKSSSPTVKKMAARMLTEKKAGGGIVAFQKGGDEGEPVEAPAQEEAPAPAPAPAVVPQQAGIIQAAPQAPVAPAPAPVQAPAPSQDYTAMMGAIKQANAPKYLKDTWALMAGDMGKSVEDRYKEKRDITERLIGPDTATQDMRAKLMAQRANAADEAERQRSMRFAQFFAEWGATPGPMLAAGLNAAKKTVGNMIEDKENQKKFQNGLDESIYKLQKADRLEKMGQLDEAEKEKSDARKIAQPIMQSMTNVYDQQMAAARAAATAGSKPTKEDKLQEKADKAIEKDPQTRMLQEGFKKDNPQPGTPEYQWYVDNLAKIRQFHYDKAGIKTESANIPLSAYPEAKKEPTIWDKLFGGSSEPKAKGEVDKSNPLLQH